VDSLRRVSKILHVLRKEKRKSDGWRAGRFVVESTVGGVGRECYANATVSKGFKDSRYLI